MKSTKRAIVSLGLMFFFGYADICAQTRDTGPWWPHPLWGPNDQAGGSNWITPAKVLEAVKMIKTGKIYELGHVYERGMPLLGQRSYSMFIPGSPTFGPGGKNNAVFYNEFLCTEIGQVGTQFDGPAHVGMRVRMSDGTAKDVFYNGFTQEEMRHAYELKKLGVENIKPYITRGLLIDIAGHKGVANLPEDYEVTLADVRGALARQKLKEARIKPGDALFFHFGWSKLWKEPEKYNHHPPGIGMEVAHWVIKKQAALVGSDVLGTEVMFNPDSELSWPVHQELIMKHGIFNIENMAFEELIEDGVYEFLFIFTPIRFRGATGSPGRPLAIR